MSAQPIPATRIRLTIPQIVEALSAENRYYARLGLGSEPSVEELLMWYVWHTKFLPTLITYGVEDEPDEHLFI